MGKLYIIPTPIGNLKDITLRALEVMKEVDLILSEDTREASKLLRHYDIHTPLQSHHMHNEHRSVEAVCARINEGKNIALISDAGTPGISDPGFLLVRTCLRHGIEVETLPGPTAFIPALINSGLPCERFTFEGFLPQKKGRQKKLEQLRDEERTMIFYESPFRLLKALEEMKEVFGAGRNASVSRELSKMFEETKRGTLAELADYFRESPARGEIVMVVAGKK
jgi:16S rRNA (cytidine1402-2'-O)-methyltransferase